MSPKHSSVAAIVLLVAATTASRAEDPANPRHRVIDLAEALDKAVHLQKSVNGSAKEVVEELAQRYQVKIFIDNTPFAQTKLPLPLNLTSFVPPLLPSPLHT